jgi:ribonuclease HII
MDDRSHARASSGEGIMPEAYGHGAVALPNATPRTLYSSPVAATTAPRLRPVLKRQVPGLDAERALWAAGHDVVVGMDEVGRGSWAGPLSIGAVVLPRDRRVNKVRDSKQLTEAEREALFDRITGWCQAWAVGHASYAECDELGMSAAQRLAARRAIEGLGVAPDRVLLDGRWDFVGGGISRTIVKGDASCLSIAAASIVAKVTRDRIMRAEAEHYPGYDFELNKGYPCPKHKVALRGQGPSAIHRRSWVFMDYLPWTGGRTRPFDPQASLF